MQVCCALVAVARAEEACPHMCRSTTDALGCLQFLSLHVTRLSVEWSSCLQCQVVVYSISVQST